MFRPDRLVRARLARTRGPSWYAAAVAAGLLLCASASLAVVLVTANRMNRQVVEAQQALVGHAVDDLVVNILTQQKSVAWWDEAAQRLGSIPLDKEWAEVEIGAFLAETYGHQQVYVVDGATALYARVEGGRDAQQQWRALEPRVRELVRHVQGQAHRPMPAREKEFAAEIARYSELGGAREARWASDLIVLDGQPSLVAAISIIPTIDRALAKRRPDVLLSVVPLDGRAIASVGRRLLLPDLDVKARSDTAGANLLLLDDQGAPVATLGWTPSRPGARLVQTLLPIIGAFILVCSLVAAALLRRLVAAWRVAAAEAKASFQQARQDILTGLPNRRSFGESLARHLTEGRSFAIAFIDVDRFKAVNDAYGHQVGDELVRTVAERLTGAISDAVIARFGGDEFAVLASCACPEEGADLGHRIAGCFIDPIEAAQRTIPASASIGIALSPLHGRDADQLLRFADIALYRAKAEARGSCRVFNDQMAADVDRRNLIETELRAALAGGGLSVAFQPIFDVASGRIQGVEALARWTHPGLGPIEPSVFVPIAEEAGLMPDLGHWVLGASLAAARRWPDLEISINLSPAELHGPNLVDGIRTQLSRSDVHPGRVVFEITESMLLDAKGKACEALTAIRKLGCRTALDDFGTGYSSLSYLRDLEFDKLKIDRSFVQRAGASRQAMTIIQSVVAMGRGLGMGLVAEGVETEADVRLMTLAGCTELQGFFLGRPLPASEIDAMVQTKPAAGRQMEWAAE